MSSPLFCAFFKFPSISPLKHEAYVNNIKKYNPSLKENQEFWSIKNIHCQTKILCEFLIASLRATCPAHIIP